MKENFYDVIVIGGGHAGVEAAYIASKLGVKVAMVTQSLETIALMPCNPSIGGPAKGVVVREISALGGIMGEVADISFLQTKILNKKKGPGVWAIRNQIDKKLYHQNIMRILEKQENLSLIEGMVTQISILNKNTIKINTKNKYFLGKKIIITTGTYASSLILQGRTKKKEGPNNLKTSSCISKFLILNNVKLIRLKTGTPPRILSTSINFKLTNKQVGNNRFWTFGNDKDLKNLNIPCYLTHTNKKTHAVIKSYLDTSFLYDGNYKIKGPSRCPSIEDKVMRFKDKERHQIFIEPDNSDFSIAYLQGLSSSLSKEGQLALLKTIPCFKNVKVLKYAYAIEYDAIQPTQLKATLEIKNINNVYSAGQINGSSGYEEAACQGLMAGINATLSLQGKKELILPRDSSYIGMLIDDLVLKGVTQPYRLLTSMMTYRMYVRSDNAYIRLKHISDEYNLLNKIEKNKIDSFIRKKKEVLQILKHLKSNILKKDIKNILENKNIQNISLFRILKNPKIYLKLFFNDIDVLKKFQLTTQEIEMIDIEIKYEGYIKKEQKEIMRINKKNSITLPQNLNYKNIPNISHAAIESLQKFNPQTLGQARQLERVTIADIINIELYLQTYNK